MGGFVGPVESIVTSVSLQLQAAELVDHSPGGAGNGRG